MIQAIPSRELEYGRESSAIDPSAYIRARAEKVVRGVLQDDVGFARAVKAMVAHTIKEYRGRFLHELIQNGYDAHPRGIRNGKIAIIFDETEGMHGVLYVANGGRPVSRSNFERMATLGESDKVIGEGIGNKGVGFKSVFQICDVPEIYSALDDTDPSFGGYSFRLGTREDLLELLERDEARTDQVEKDLSLSMLTIPLFDVPNRSQELRDQGYVTVLRLPVSSPHAANEVQDRIDRLRNSTAPVMLFLDRLSSMTIQSNSKSEVEVLSRNESPMGSLGKRVVLNDELCFRVVSHEVPQDRLHSALQVSVDEGALDARWLEWDATAEVSVAVGDGWEVSAPRAFTYLPMGDNARAPLSGHINGPFVTDFARLGLDIEQPVNRMLLESAAELCVRSAKELMAIDPDANSVVDLVAWASSDLGIVDEACVRLSGQSLLDAIRVPCLGLGWETMSTVHRWPDVSGDVISPAAIAGATDARLIDPARLGKSRLLRLAETVELLDSTLNPAPELVAEWVEYLAADLASSQATPEVWRKFYDDLPNLFASGEPLFGRKLLLSGDGIVVPCDRRVGDRTDGTARRRNRAVFFAPKSTSTDDDDAVDSDLDVSPPRSLQQRLVFMHPELEWNVGPQRTRGRAFLQDNGLARQFRTAGLLQHLGQVMSGPTTPRVKKDALEFAFRLFANNPTKHSKDLVSVGLEVPTLEGSWIPADRARFSAGWAVLGAEELSLLAGLPSSTCPELSRLSDVLLAERHELDVTGTQTERWRDFLLVVGVTATIPVIERAEQRSFIGKNLTAHFLAGGSVPDDVPSEVVTQWRPALAETGNLHHPDTGFTTTDPICWFMGQHELSGLPQRERLAYARLILRTLPSVKVGQRHSTWRRQRAGGQSSVIPTPLTAFLMSEEWMPVARPGSAVRDFAAPDGVWFVNPDDLMAASYSPVLDASLRALLTAMPGFSTERKKLGLRLWGDSTDAPELVDHLTDLLDGGDVPDTALEHFRSTLASAWAHIGNPSCQWRPSLNRGITVDRAGHLTVAETEDEGSEPLFVTAIGDKSTTTRLIRELAWPTVDVDSTDKAVLDEVATVLDSSWPGNVQVASGWQLDVLTNGSPWQPALDSRRLVDEVPWLPLLVACTMRFPRASALRAGKQIPNVLDDLSRIRLIYCESITIATAAGQQGLPQRLRGVLPMPGAAPTLLAEGVSSPLTWPNLEVLAEAALELMGQSRFSAELSLNLRKLAGDATATSSSPEYSEIADALGAPIRSVVETQAMVAGSVAGLVERLSHVAPCLWDVATASTIRPDNPDLLTMDGVRTSVTAAYAGDSDAAGKLLQAADDSATSDELRLRLGIGLPEFNEALRRHFPGTRTIDYGDQFAHEFGLRKSVRRKELINRARHSRLQRFRDYEMQSDWPSLRDLSFLTADPEWGASIDELTDDLADERIDSLMTIEFGQILDRNDLPDWDQVREANGKPLHERLQAVSRTIKAWCAREGTIPAASWSDGAAPDAVRKSLDSVGALDFDVVDDITLMRWLDRLDLWPSGMELTLDMVKLGLTDGDVEAQESAAAAERRATLRRLRQVTLHGKVVDLDETMSGFVEAVQKLLEGNPKSLQTPYQTSRLQDVAPGSGNNRTSSTRPKGQRVQRMSDTQRNAVGLAGELIAYRWLLDRDPGHVDELCWKSTNSSLAIVGQLGDDGLGYDFEVPRKTGNVMYEVKATQGDWGMIELGETEVRCAQEYARTDRWRLLVVEEALSMSPRILMLPNPFRPDSRSLFRFVGNSVRLRFTLES
ncbi:hypothetical protein J2W14_004271 [Pseudarthrobacter oxydans]|uniref:DUF3883 domain-containing protein n=1 Tax=Pseudarthrobacter oxydans TaxID=1671 RepID=UPI0027805CA9|nr:DUF3883 domain-containing protein [Pseudarthrobacter oxydans]MDP9984844.1 hypothetical protein [Pseudarthrobacter oxydans]